MGEFVGPMGSFVKAELAKQSPEMGFTSLAHHIDVRWLHEAFLRTRRDGAAGVDGQVGEDYVTSLGDNLRSLLDRAKSGTYRAPPVRRVHIPKGTGGDTRPFTLRTRVVGEHDIAARRRAARGYHACGDRWCRAAQL